jgi:succinate dehydrogenase flavin-adding protein (antitoxin of CptAB toxin-antitoxin module)
MRELDRLLDGYRLHELPQATEEERQAFIRLLAFPDPVLAGWLLAREEEPAHDFLLCKLIVKVRGCVDVKT